MNLKTYLVSIDMSIKEFSQLLEVSPGYLSRIIHGREVPGKRLTKDIHAITQGAVNIEQCLQQKTYPRPRRERKAC